MSEEIEMQDKQTKKTVNRKKLYYSIAALVVVACGIFICMVF